MNQCIIFNPVARHVNQENLVDLDGFPIYSPFTVDSKLVTASYINDLSDRNHSSDYKEIVSIFKKLF